MGFTPTPPSEVSASVPPSVPGTGCGLGSPVGSVCDPATIPFHPAPQYLRKAERGERASSQTRGFGSIRNVLFILPPRGKRGAAFLGFFVIVWLFFFYIFFFFVFLGPHPRHMEVPRLGG